ncbi:MAG: sensor histidine kinase [Clostridiales bacterium]|nr:sensor histidine kinase [Clostridiales bacterium]
MYNSYYPAEENQIDFTVRIQIPKELPIQDSDISVLLGNLLENAITAVTSAPDGQQIIRLNMIVSRKTLIITVDNGFDGIVSYKNGEYLSTKPKYNGLGLKSITSIAEKYGGGVEFTHEDMVFHSSVMLEFCNSFEP